MDFKRLVPALVAAASAAGATPAAAGEDETAASGRDNDQGFVVGLDVGYASVGGEQPITGGFGRSLALGFQFGRWSVEWRPLERYDLNTDTGDATAVPDAALEISSIVVQRSFWIGTDVLTPVVGVGPLAASTPLLVTGPEGDFVADARHGVGAVVCGGLLVNLSRGMYLQLDGRAYLASWERLGEQAVKGTDEGIMQDNDPDDPTPFSINLGLRLYL